MAAASLLRALRRVLPRDRILVDRGELALYDSDGLTLHRALPGGVVIVETADEVRGVLRALAADGEPFVARGAGTGLSGGAVALNDAWVVDVHRMNRIRTIHALDRYAVVEPGVVNLDLDRAAAAHGLRYAPDPSSQRACTLGGNLAENSGGPRCFLYGMTTRHVLGVTVVLPDGDTVVFGGQPGSSAGEDWRGLFVGAEGTLGIVVEAVLALLPRPERARTCLAAFPTLVAACRAVARIVAAGARPAALEILDRLTIQAVESSIYGAGYPTGAGAVLLVEQEGSDAEIAADTPTIEAACRDEQALSFEEAETPEERERLWRGRKSAFGAMGRLASDLYVLDGVVPRRRLAEVVEEVAAIGARHDVRLSNVFHAGDGNLHPNISFDGRNPEETERVLAASAEIMALCVSVGGTLSGEHGIGMEKRDYFQWVFNDDDRATQQAVRDAVDPEHRANPCKIFPAGRGCVEAGHRGPEFTEYTRRILGHTP